MIWVIVIIALVLYVVIFFIGARHAKMREFRRKEPEKMFYVERLLWGTVNYLQYIESEYRWTTNKDEATKVTSAEGNEFIFSLVKYCAVNANDIRLIDA